MQCKCFKFEAITKSSNDNINYFIGSNVDYNNYSKIKNKYFTHFHFDFKTIHRTSKKSDCKRKIII